MCFRDALTKSAFRMHSQKGAFGMHSQNLFSGCTHKSVFTGFTHKVCSWDGLTTRNYGTHSRQSKTHSREILVVPQSTLRYILAKDILKTPNYFGDKLTSHRIPSKFTPVRKYTHHVHIHSQKIHSPLYSSHEIHSRYCIFGDVLSTLDSVLHSQHTANLIITIITEAKKKKKKRILSNATNTIT